MKTIFAKVPYALLGIFLGVALPALAATNYSAGNLIQIGDIQSTHILDSSILNVDVSHTTTFNFDSLKIGTTTAFSKLAVWGTGTTTGTTMYVANSASTTLFTILDNGNVGIASTSPTHKLDITGTLGVTGTTTFSGDVLIPATSVAAGAFLAADSAGKIIATSTPAVVSTYPSFFVGTSTTVATYTTPANAAALHVKMCGGGAGGSDTNVGSGVAGTATKFGNSTQTASTTANGALAGDSSANPSTPGIGGSGGLSNVGTVLVRMKGGDGGSGSNPNGYSGGMGGNTVFGGAGGAGRNTNATAGAPNTCSGGGGSGTGTNNQMGGGAGEYVEFVIPAPDATYRYQVGVGGTSVYAGANGIVMVTAYYH